LTFSGRPLAKIVRRELGSGNARSSKAVAAGRTAPTAARKSSRFHSPPPSSKMLRRLSPAPLPTRASNAALAAITVPAWSRIAVALPAAAAIALATLRS
jgi:hypothetical protein